MAYPVSRGEENVEICICEKSYLEATNFNQPFGRSDGIKHKYGRVQIHKEPESLCLGSVIWFLSSLTQFVYFR